ncbi:MAG: hypothetical protein QNI97_10440, partial [Desulfobacterales bacterium]|nr:hypothetical protein [Desulfobacterales bacterium]
WHGLTRPGSGRGLLRQIDDEAAAALDCETEATAAATSEASRWYDPPRYLAGHAPINYSNRIGQFLLGVPADICNQAGCLPLTMAAAAGP